MTGFCFFALFVCLCSGGLSVRTLSIGGLARQKEMTYISFPGGFVWDSSTLQKILETYEIVSPDAPQPFQWGQFVTFTWSEAYPISETQPATSLNFTDVIPLEFTYQPSDFRLFEWVSSSDSSGSNDLYNRVLEYFDQIPDSSSPFPWGTFIIVVGVICVVAISVIVFIVIWVRRRHATYTQLQ